jgi:hypothetical protein
MARLADLRGPHTVDTNPIVRNRKRASSRPAYDERIRLFIISIFALAYRAMSLYCMFSRLSKN